MSAKIQYSIYFLFILIFCTVLSFDIVCSGGKLNCDRHKCIPPRWLCDGTPDCDDGTDELKSNCPVEKTQHSTCKHFQVKCNSGACIPRAWICDGQKDCDDASDEDPVKCQTLCTKDEFKCSNGPCIDYKWRCDGREDCLDGSDEANCTIPVEKDDRWFECDSGFMVPISWKCDGSLDCEDSSDEKDCPKQPETEEKEMGCLKNEFKCPGSYCILKSWVCNGLKDCLNGEDEIDCPYRQCKSNEFRCEEGNCLRSWYRCDGSNDCKGGSDEKDCSKILNPTTKAPIKVIETAKPQTVKTNSSTTTNTPRCEYDEFMCKSSRKCIPNIKICDQYKDCEKGEDETVELCGVNECKNNNGGCVHNCIDTKDGYYCTCDKGFRAVGTYNCEDIDECTEVPGVCSQLCTNTEGGYHCSCLPGYMKDPRNYTRCKATKGDTYLLFSHGYDIRQIRLKDFEMQSVVTDTNNAIALDYSYRDEEIFWCEKKDKKIMRAKQYNSDDKHVILANKDVSTDGLAVDWIHKNLYFTDNRKSTVNLASWKGSIFRTIVSTNMTHPRAIVVLPSAGLIYWTDWGLDPKIERSGLDGYDRVSLIRNSKYVMWPNGLTIDHVQGKLYWCDGLLKSIFSSDLEGGNIEVILYSTTYLNHPFSVSVFEDNLYWTDWSKLAIYSANKFTGEGIVNISSSELQSPKVVHVMHPYRQPKSKNVCDGHNCQHFCVRDLMGQPICVCADGYTEDGNKCVDSVVLAADQPVKVKEKITMKELEEEISLINSAMKSKCVKKSKSIDTENIELREDESYCEDLTDEVNLGVIIGTIIAVVVILAIIIVGMIWLRATNRPIKRILFPSSVYMRTTEEYPEGGGFVFNHGQKMVYKSSKQQYADAMLLDSDDVPLAPKDDLI